MKKIFSVLLTALSLYILLPHTSSQAAQGGMGASSSKATVLINAPEKNQILPPPSLQPVQPQNTAQDSQPILQPVLQQDTQTTLQPLTQPNAQPNAQPHAQPSAQPPHQQGSQPTKTTLGPIPAGTSQGLGIYDSVAPVAPSAPPPTAGKLPEQNLPASPLPATSPTPAAPTEPPAPVAPTAEEIEEARKQDALRKEQEAQRQRELALAQEQLRKEQNYVEAARAYAQGDAKKAFGLWDALAKEEHPASMTALGLMYDRGHGVLLNSKEAVMWFRQAADAGDKDGMYHLGRMLAQGRGGMQHVATAATWLQKAADLGQHDAQYLLAVLYERGEGVIQNDSTAAAWYSLAAAGLNVEAQARLGHLYRIGKGVAQNKERATLLLYGATMAGHSGAQQELFAMSQEAFAEKGFPKVTLFGANFASEQGITRAQMRSALSVSKVKALREDINFICDVYDLTGSVPGAHQMAVCYGAGPASSGTDAKGNTPSAQAQQEMGFLKIDYAAAGPEQAKAIQNMVEGRFGAPSAGEQGQGYLWNLGNVIVATQYIPQKKEVGLMYMIPRVYHTTQGK